MTDFNKRHDRRRAAGLSEETCFAIRDEVMTWKDPSGIEWVTMEDYAALRVERGEAYLRGFAAGQDAVVDSPELAVLRAERDAYKKEAVRLQGEWRKAYGQTDLKNKENLRIAAALAALQGTLSNPEAMEYLTRKSVSGPGTHYERLSRSSWKIADTFLDAQEGE
jgi:hypothetical protein